MKFLLADIEQGPNTAYVWSARTKYVPKGHMLDTSRTLCMAWKWFGKRGPTKFVAEWSPNRDHIEEIWHVLDEADAIITYNGKKFDIPSLNWEFAQRGMPPPRTSHQIDLFRVVKANFRMPYYSLDYVSSKLGLGGKVPTKGMELWHDCMTDQPAAQKFMERYNKRDVTMMGPLYKHLRPWIKSHPIVGLFDPDGAGKCPVCKHSKIEEIEPYITTLAYKQYQCKSCHSTFRNRNTYLRPDESRELYVPTGV